MEHAVLGETSPDAAGVYKGVHRAYSCMRVNGETYVVKMTILEEAGTKTAKASRLSFL